MVKKRELTLQGSIFLIMCAAGLLLLAEAVGFRLGRLVFAIAMSAVCLAAEGYALVKVLGWVWKVSASLSAKLESVLQGEKVSSALLTEPKN
jgi:hypothetical protein